MTITMTGYNTRDNNGLLQVRNTFEVPNGKGGYKTVNRWQYVIQSFTSDDKGAWVSKSNGAGILVPIDSRDRITIKGRKIGRAYWHH